MDIGKATAELLKESYPSDEVVLDKGSYEEIMELYDKFVGERDNGIHDIILSGTVPLKDIRVKLEDDILYGNGIGSNFRFVIFENALDNLESAPNGRTLLVGAIQYEKDGSFSLLGIVKGEDSATISQEVFSFTGKETGKTSPEKLSSLWHTWCAIEFALLHPSVKTVFSNPETRKEYAREKDGSGKRRRIVKYVRKHILSGEAVEKSLREINRHCLSWYVIGHWRNLPDGRTTWVKGHWKGELRELKMNLDEGRLRAI